LRIVIDLKLLRHALTLARHRNFARAAEALDLSQPALSRSIAGLETALGAQLFNRTRQGVVPTAFGERLLARGGSLLADAAELERELRLMRGLEAGVLRVGAGPYPADLCVGPALGRLASQHPGLRIELNTGDWRGIVKEVLDVRLDLAVVELSIVAQDARLQTEPLPRHGAAFYCRAEHPLLREREPTVEQAFAFPFVCTKLPARVGRMFYRLAKSGAIDPDTGDYLPPVKVDTVALATATVLTSNAIALAPLGLIADGVQAGRLATLPFSEPWLHTHYGFVHLRNRALDPAALAFMAEVRAVEAEQRRRESVMDARPTPSMTDAGGRA
jgi:DNA-binding transcriptional LysR family regulator